MHIAHQSPMITSDVWKEDSIHDWKSGNITNLLQEGRTIQRRIPKYHQESENNKALPRTFSKLMFEGKTNAALCLLTEQHKGSILPLNSIVPSNGSEFQMVHAAYAAFTHGMVSKWQYLSRTIPNIGDHLQHLEDIIRTQLIPALMGRAAPSESERMLLALPARLGGLGIINPTDLSASEYPA